VPSERFIEQLENDPALLEPARLRQRLDVLDRLDAYFPEMAGPEIPGAEGDSPDVVGLARRARLIRDRLEAANQEVYESIREEIRRGSGRGALLRWVEPLRGLADADAAANGMGFDFRDELICGVLQLEEPEDGQLQRDAEMVFYQPTPARHIFDLIRLTALTADDVFIDIGSGLGHVPLLISICTNARAVGIELEGGYVERAGQCAERLNLKKASFLPQDARTADYFGGTVFYLYTPFSGVMLRAVLDRLKRVAAVRRIRICTYGPCTSVIAEEPWLTATATPETDRITVFSSRDSSLNQ
jgi:hypothetical protein